MATVIEVSFCYGTTVYQPQPLSIKTGSQTVWSEKEMNSRPFQGQPGDRSGMSVGSDQTWAQSPLAPLGSCGCGRLAEVPVLCLFHLQSGVSTFPVDWGLSPSSSGSPFY